MVLLNMNQLIITTLTVTLFMYHYMPVTFCINPLYGTCPTVPCGTVNITYPFHIVGKQQSHCGYPGFEVYCHNGNIPYVNISGDSYVILHMWYEKQSFQVMNSVVWDAVMNGVCISSINNLTLQDSIFKFSDVHVDIIILLDCTNKSLGSNERDRLLGSKCGTVAVYKDDKRLSGLEKNCSGVRSVPYEGVRDDSSSIKDVLRRGILLNWTSNNCSACTESGGQCGFNRSTNEFKCYCRDHDHAYHCVTKKKDVRLIAGLSVAGCVIMLTLAFMAIWHRKKLMFNHSKYVSRSNSLDRITSNLEKGSIYFGVPLFSYRELQEATDGFNRSRELGDGGFGTVYYGKLKDGREVAVKRLFEKSYKRVEQFMNEVEILTCLRHQNLVSLYGCTSHHSRELLLVYEFVPNGTVADHLFGDRSKSKSLPWNTRLRIAIETASALSYLHASDIIHRDVKTNNILLDSSFSVKVADFGLSRLFPNDVTHVSTAPQGTPGYLDPEYHQCYQLTDKSDVYSFGVVLIELISSLPAVDMDRHRQEINLSNYAMNRIQRCAFEELVDLKLGFMSDYNIRKMTTAVAELAFQCLQHDKEFRPSMDEVLERLKNIEATDYEAMKAEESRKNNGTGACSTPPPPSPTKDDDAKLLSSTNNEGKPCSPTSVMDKWGSKNTTPSTSK